MALLLDGETVAAVVVGGADRAALVWDTATKSFYYKDQAGTSGPIVNGVASFNTRTGAVLPVQADYDAFFLTPAEGNAAYDPLGAAAAAAAGSQPLDADLTAIAALAGQTAFGRNFLTIANTAAALAYVVTAGTVTNALLANMAASTVKGSIAGGVPADLSPAQLTTNFVVPDGSTLEISANQIREKDGGTTNAKLANVATATFKGRTTAGAGVPEDLTVVQATALLVLATAALQGLMSAPQFVKMRGMYLDAVADGGCDSTGAVDCTAQLQALNDSLSVSGGIVFFPPGKYKIATTVNATSNNVRWLGAGRRCSIIQASTAIADIFSVTGDCVVFEQLRFGATADNVALRTAGYALNFGTASDSSGVFQCDILYQWSAIQSSAGLQWFDDVNIREYGANNPNGAGILVNGTGDRYLHRIVTDNGTNPTGFAGCRVTECASLTMSDCNWIHCTTCLALEPANGKTVPSIEVVNSFFDSSVKGMAITPAGTGVAYRSKFTNCWFGSNTTAGVEMNGTQWDGFTFDNCDFYGNAIGISTPTGGTKWCVANSRFAGNTTAGISLTASANHNVKIIGNDIGPTAAFGVNLVGITIAAGTYKGIQLLGNTLVGNTTNFTNNATAPAAADANLYRITDNPGINPRSTSVAPAVPATTVAATNNTGFIVTVYLKGGTLTVITVNGVAIGQTVPPTANMVLPIRLEPGATIAITYTVVPTWIWITD